MGETLCLRWSAYESNIKSGFSNLRRNAEFCDVTLSCAGSNPIRAHRVVLSACSAFFHEILVSIPHEKPFIYLRGIRQDHLESILSFMYHGEVRVLPDDLNDFLAVAEELQVNGLMQEPSPSSAYTPSTLQAPKQEPKTEPEYHERPPQSSGVKREISFSPTTSLPQKKRSSMDQTDQIQEDYEGISPSTSISGGLQQPYEETGEESDLMDGSNPSRDELLDAELLKYVSSRDANNVYKCLKCAYSSVSRLNVKKHVEARHFVTDGHRCDKCERVFKTRETLSKHSIKVHKGESVYFSTAN